MAGNPVDRRHVEQAIYEVRECREASEAWDGVTDDVLTVLIRNAALRLRSAETDGDAEAAHEQAKVLAAMTIEYMARGLA